MEEEYDNEENNIPDSENKEIENQNENIFDSEVKSQTKKKKKKKKKILDEGSVSTFKEAEDETIKNNTEVHKK